jgi:hypothetical protein
VSVDVRASYLPDFPGSVAGQGAPGQTVITGPDGVRAVAAYLDPGDVPALCDALESAGRRLRGLPVGRVIDAVDAAARRLRDPGDSVHRELRASLTALSGLSPAMADHVLQRVSEDWLAPSLHRLLVAELGGAEAVDGFIRRGDGRRARVIAPALGLHVFSGNVPGVSVTSIVRALLVRSAVIGKPAAGEPAMAAAFARLLAEADPDVGACVAVHYWTGGDAALEDAFLARVGLVVHYGGDDAIAALRARARPDTRFIEHGPRLSFAIIDPAGLEDAAAAARDLALATALFDQQGCVSPQVAWILGPPVAAATFAEHTAIALRDIHDEMPRGRLDAAEAAAIHQLRASAEFRAIQGDDVRVWTGAGLSFTVIADPASGFGGSCLNRTLIVKAVDSVESLMRQLGPARRFLQTAGVAGFRGDRLLDLAARLGDAGVTRITPVAEMPWPPVDWRHDGRGPLTELIHWLDLEG